MRQSMAYLDISTHSLTRRLTLLSTDREKHIHISTHSLTRRLTFLAEQLNAGMAFQLTASQGG